jgi:NADH-quinone oxidoreductase subunit K
MGGEFMIGPSEYILVGLILFIMGISGVILRRNIIFILISLEVAVNGIFLVFFGAGLKWGAISHAIILILIAIAAVEAAVGLALAIAVFRTIKNVNSDELSKLKR